MVDVELERLETLADVAVGDELVISVGYHTFHGMVKDITHRKEDLNPNWAYLTFENTRFLHATIPQDKNYTLKNFTDKDNEIRVVESHGPVLLSSSECYQIRK